MTAIDFTPDTTTVGRRTTVPEPRPAGFIADTVTIAGPDGNPVPGIAPAAKQQGRYAAATIKARLKGKTLPPFRYKHAGSLAQIGNRLAVIDFGRGIKLRGAIAWWIWRQAVARERAQEERAAGSGEAG